ncbi:MAG: hypothetical protein ACK5L0_03990 [Candidatus Fimivivens sp.]
MSDAAPNDKTQSNEQDDTQHCNNAYSKFHSHARHNVAAYPQDVLLASVTLALTLTQGRSQYEVETLINLFSLTTDNLQAILAQMLINRKVQTDLETMI